MNLDLRLKNILPTFLTEGLSIRFRAMGKSMYPFIKDKNIVTAAPFKGTVPVSGQVVVIRCKVSGKIIVHRVVGEKKRRFLIKGDNCPDDDGYFSRQEIIGYISGVEGPVRNFILRSRIFNRGIALLSRSGILNTLHPLFRLGGRIKQTWHM